MKRITHDGIVDSVSGDELRVRIIQSSACAACKVAGHCNASESKEKIVAVCDEKAARRYKAGDKVTVSMPGEKGHQAVVWAFIVPFLLMVTTVFVLVKWTGDEGLAALCSVAILVPYYMSVYLMRGKIATRFTFTIDDDLN